MSNLPDKSEIIKQIQHVVPPGSPEPRDPRTLKTLADLTARLIQAYKDEGKLQVSPLAGVQGRRIHLYDAAVRERLQGKNILVTGGAGYVGQHLVEKLRQYDLGRLITLDIARAPMMRSTERQMVRHYQIDVRDYASLRAVFETEKPDIVFHLAAQRLPGPAEVLIRDTIGTNVFGTKNVIRLCDMYGVENCIYSSTGKCFTYFTSNIYAASKKMAEMQFALATQNTRVNYGMVRFTHIIENSAAGQEIDQGIYDGLVKLHGPDRYIYIQNVSEAIHLLLNALTQPKPDKKIKFLTTRNIGWPVSVMEIALHRIDQSGERVPLYFFGLPKGYDDSHFFKGLFDWSGETELHPLINALESPSSIPDASGDMLIATGLPFSASALNAHLVRLKTLVDDAMIPQAYLKDALSVAGKDLLASTFAQTSPLALLNVLKWGANPDLLAAEGIDISLHRPIVELLAQTIYRRLDDVGPQYSDRICRGLDELIGVLSTLPTIHREVDYLRSVYERRHLATRSKPAVLSSAA